MSGITVLDFYDLSCDQTRTTRDISSTAVDDVDVVVVPYLPGTLDGGLCGVDGLEGNVTESGNGDHGGSETETRSRADGGTEKRHLVLVVCRWGCCWVVCWIDK